jgi:hypothetical protein
VGPTAGHYCSISGEDEKTLAPEHEGESEMRDAASSIVIEDGSM